MSDKYSYFCDIMNVRNSLGKRLMRCLKTRQGQAVLTRDFLHLGPRAAVDQALSRLARNGTLLRLGRGMYEFPKIGTLFNKPVPQTPDTLIKAWARKNNLRVLPSGAYAANILGLSTQVPAKIVYYTNGSPQTVRLGGLTLHLLNRGPRSMDMREGVSARVVSALQYLGRKNITDIDIARLREIYRPKTEPEWTFNSNLAPVWIRDIMMDVAHGKDRTR